MPRKSAAELSVVRPASTATSTPLSPVVRIAQLEQSIFNLTVTRHTHLKPADSVLVTAYARAAALVLKLSGSPADLEKATRTMVLLGRSLRLTPQAAVSAKVAGRMRRDAQPSPLDEYFLRRDAEKQQEESNDDP
jgi:hypothetical protein